MKASLLFRIDKLSLKNTPYIFNIRPKYKKICTTYNDKTTEKKESGKESTAVQAGPGHHGNVFTQACLKEII